MNIGYRDFLTRVIAMADHAHEKPIRAAVFHDLEKAEHAVHELEQHGFTEDEITVVCSDREKESHFRPYEHQEPAGYYTPAALALGGACGAVIGALVGVLAMVLIGETSMLLTIAAFAALTGGAIGAFFATMMTRGVEGELANFYDQDVERGGILVAAEDHTEHAEEHLEEASHILSDCGAKPIELSEG